MSENDRINKLKKSISQILSYKESSLVSRPAWGEISFAELEFDIKTVLSFADSLQGMPLEYLPDNAVDTIIEVFDNILPKFESIDKFSIVNGGDPTYRRNQIISDFHSQANSIYSQVAIWLPYLAYQKGDVSENIKKLSNAIDIAQIKMEEGVAEIEKKQKQADQILVKARDAAANAGAAVFTQDFQKEAESNKKNSWVWLVITAILGFSALVIAIEAYLDDYAKYTNAISLWPKLASKMLVLSILFTASMWCGRIYKSMRHLSIVNRHRALGLKTFQAFSAAASDDHTKDAVLMETTHSIFANTNTGLVNEASTADSESNIIQIAGRVMEQSSPK